MKWLCLFLMFGAAAGAAPKTDAEAIAAAQKVAKAFLAAVDAGNARSAANMGYDIEHKDPKSGRVRRVSAVGENIVQARRDARKRLGKLLERKLERTEIMEDGPGAFPRGQYVRFTYQLVFEQKARQRESLTIKVDAPQAGKVVSFH